MRVWHSLFLTWLLPSFAFAQSFDCHLARDAVDQAICASSRLRQLDTQLARGYAAALSRDAARADAIRLDQQVWAKGRSACLTGTHVPAAAKETPEQCLTTAYANRLAALTPAAPPPSATVTTAPVAESTARPTNAATTAPPPHVLTGTPIADQPPPSGTGKAGVATPEAARFAELLVSRSVYRRCRPPPRPLDRTHFPTAGESSVLLRVTTPGRFAIRAESPTGTAIRLVDMLTGPGERAGWPGKQDGRIDALLDIGTYKLRVSGAIRAAAGDTTLSVAPFTPAAPDQIAPGYLPVSMTLGDLQVQSFWVAVGDASSTTRIEAAGRGWRR